MSRLGYFLHWFVPVRVARSFCFEFEGRPILVSYSSWLFRDRKLMHKREWVYLDG